jgi:GTP cyclohydrolase I
MSQNMEESIKSILYSIGEDITREGLMATPRRCSESIKFLTQGYQLNLQEIVGNGLFTNSGGSCKIVIADIPLFSLCEHHLLPFFGTVKIVYQPDEKLLGLSKFAKIVQMFARRLQLQERLTKEIAEAIESVTGALGVGVQIEASHMCMMMREIQQNCKTTTTFCFGAIKKSDF